LYSLGLTFSVKHTQNALIKPFVNYLHLAINSFRTIATAWQQAYISC